MNIETNKIYLGSCYELIKDIPDKSIDLVYIDIPYEISYSVAGSFKNKISDALCVQLGGDKNLTYGIDYSIFDELCRVMKKIYIYIWCSKEQIYDIMTYFINKGCYFNLLVWCKDNPIPFGGAPFLSDLEYCLCFWEKNCKFNDGWENKIKHYNSFINQKDKELYGHPTIKPLNFIKKQILNSTQPNDIVLDCFMGSGTTCVACKETGRRYIGIEINPDYYKIAEDRLKGITKTGQMSLDLFSEQQELDLE